MQPLGIEIAQAVRFIKPLYTFRRKASEDKDGRLVIGFGKAAGDYASFISSEAAEKELSADLLTVWAYLSEKMDEGVWQDQLGRFSRTALVSLYYDVGIGNMESGGDGAFPRNCVIEAMRPGCDMRLVGLTQFRRFAYNGFLKSAESAARREAETAYFQRSRCYRVIDRERGSPMPTR